MFTGHMTSALSQVGGGFREFRFSSQEAQSEEEKEKQEQRQVREGWKRGTVF